MESSFLPEGDSSVFSHIRSSVDMSDVWQRLLCCVDAALDGRFLDEPSDSEKDIPTTEHMLFFALGVFDLPDDQEMRLKVRTSAAIAPRNV